MQIWKRFFMLICALSLILFGSSSLSAAPNADGQDCASIQAWVQANEANLPTSYPGLSSLPIAYRKAVFNALPASVKSSLWQEHFRAYMAAHPDLTAEQIAIIHQVSALASPEFFAAHTDMENRNKAGVSHKKDLMRLMSLEAEAADLFSESELRALLANLGPAEGESPSTQGISCECNVSDDWCGGSYDCYYATCDYQSSGCGTLWSKSCNGLCYQP